MIWEIRRKNLIHIPKLNAWSIFVFIQYPLLSYNFTDQQSILVIKFLQFHWSTVNSCNKILTLEKKKQKYEELEKLNVNQEGWNWNVE